MAHYASVALATTCQAGGCTCPARLCCLWPGSGGAVVACTAAHARQAAEDRAKFDRWLAAHPQGPEARQ
jgi:hypothetical protein